MQFSKNWLKDFIDIDLSTGTICSQLTMAGLEVDGYEDVNFLKDKFSSESGLVPYIITLFIAGFTPVPFKLLTITSGFIQFNLLIFFITSVFTRGLRFFLLAFLVHKFGEAIGPFIEKKGAKYSMILGIIIVIVLLAVYFVIKNYA